MASVSVPAADVHMLARGGVCAKSGTVATRTISMRLVHTPGWVWILLFFGILPFVIAYLFTKKVIGVDVPASSDVARRRFRTWAWMWGTLAVSVALILTGAFSGNSAPSWVGIAGVIAAVMALPFGARVWINASYDGEVVRLSRLDPNYVAALGLPPGQVGL